MKPERISKFGENWVQEDAYDALEAIVKELAESDPIIYSANTFEQMCKHCGALDYDHAPSLTHKPDCLWLRAKALMSD